MRLAVRTPFAGRALLDFLAFHVVPGVEARRARAGTPARSTSRTAPAPSGSSSTTPPATGQTAFVTAEFRLHDLRDTAAAVERARRLVDADCDPVAVDDQFLGDPVIGPLVRATRGLRVPGQVDGDETAIRTVVGQQVSVTGARTVTGRLVAAYGTPVETETPGLTHLFPSAATLAEVDPEALPMPRSRGRALTGLAAALAAGDVALDRGADRDEVRAALRRAARHRSLDRRLRRDARARPPRRLPADRHRRPQRDRRPRPRPGRGGRRQRPLEALALLRPDAPLEHPHAPDPPPSQHPHQKED